MAALIDGTVMTLGTIYVVFFAHSNFIGQFQGFLITLGVPIAAWCGIMLADIALRRRDYAEPELFTARGRYGDIRWLPVLTVVVATGLGWGLVTNGLASWLTWQGYLLGPFGLGGKTRRLGLRQPRCADRPGPRLRRDVRVQPGLGPGRGGRPRDRARCRLAPGPGPELANKAVPCPAQGFFRRVCDV